MHVKSFQANQRNSNFLSLDHCLATKLYYESLVYQRLLGVTLLGVTTRSDTQEYTSKNTSSSFQLGILIKELQRHESVLLMCCDSPKVMGDRLGSIRWWDVMTGLSSCLNTHRGGVHRIKFAPVRIGDTSRGRIAALFNDHTFAVYDLVSPLTLSLESNPADLVLKFANSSVLRESHLAN